MSKISLTDLVNLQNETTAVNAINTNFSTIQTAFDNTFSRDDTPPNQMEGPIDMNGSQIINLPSPDTSNSPLRLQDLTSFLGTGTIVVGQTSVGSITILKNLPVGSYQTVNVLGYYTSGDGGGGTFYYDSLSSAADNGGTIIAPTTGTGRWKRMPNTANYYTPKMFGAHADGTSDTSYIQNAVNFISSIGGGTLFLDVMYTIGGSLNANGFSLINLLSGVNIDGPGGLKLANNTNVLGAQFTATCSGTTMTVSNVTFGSVITNQFINASGFTSGTKVVTQLGGIPNGAGTYQLNTSQTVSSGVVVHACNRMVEMIGSYSPSVVNDVTYKNFLLDYNGQNNCASQTIWSFNSVATINNGNNVFFNNVRFRNNCGSNSICLGIRQATPTLSNAIITNCSFENDGDRINAVSTDYSTIFAICSGLSITDNVFALGPTINGAALEVYGNDINMSGNTVTGYYSTLNLVAISGQITNNVNFTGNTLNVGNGPTLWTLDNTAKLRNVNFVGNTCNITITAAGGPYFINGTGQVTTGSELDNINIVGNLYSNYVQTDLTRTSAAISLSAVFSAKISGNTIFGSPGPGVYITHSDDPVAIEISNNSLLDTGYCNTSSLKTGITLDASGTSGSLCIQDNIINPISGYTLTSGINNALTVSSGIILNNIISGATTPLVNTGSGVSISIPVSGGGTGTTTSTGTGSVVLNNGPTLIAPVLGTPASGILTNCTGTAAGLTAGAVAVTGITGLATGVATFLGTPSSANLKTAVTDETGSGSLVFATSPTLVTPVLGTPSSGTLTSCTGLPISGVTGLQTTGTWTPTDQSGAALTFTAVNCRYTQIGNMIHAYGTFTFPTTANASANLIGGLPIAVPNVSYAATANAVKTSIGTSAVVAVPVINTSNFTIWSNSSGASVTNSLFSTAAITVNIIYPAT